MRIGIKRRFGNRCGAATQKNSRKARNGGDREKKTLCHGEILDTQTSSTRQKKKGLHPKM
jgi:hypothetical protein